MPGIAGFISRGNLASQRGTLEQMIRSMLHEDSYNSGAHIDELGVAVGWTCHRGAFADCLPIWNETRDICLILAGEIFTDAATRKELQARGHSFDGQNASFLVHLYEDLGARFFETLNGVFSGVLIDRREQKVMLFNDRYGLSRVYYHEGKDGFYFASEAKALLRVLPHLRALDFQGFGEWLNVGCVLQNRTLFSKVLIVPPASVWSFGPAHTPDKRAYFSKNSWETQPQLSPDQYYEKLKDTITRVLPRYFRDSEQAAMSLTGGLDSRVIMAWARPAPSTLPCYSHRGTFRECLDSRIARRVAAVCRQPHQTITVNGEFCRQFPTLAKQTVYISDGTMDVSGATGLYVNRIAKREIASVRMTGNYGSEILRRLIAFKPKRVNESLFARDFIPNVRVASELYASEKREDPLSFIAFKQMPWHHYSRFMLEQSQITVRSPYLDNDLVAVAYQAPADLSVNQNVAARLIRDGNSTLAGFPTDRGPLGRNGIVGKLREQYEEFTFKAEYAYDYGMPQWLAKTDNLLRPLRLERLFLGRHKYYHFRTWYRNELAPYVRDLLLDKRTLQRSYLNASEVTKAVNAHVTGRGNYTLDLHNLISSELIQRHLIEE
jgi:asparagine synthase (glutamine-hydrolysing)